MTKRRRSTKAGKNTILACDPSLTAWGWAIINWDGSVVAHGCIQTEPLHKKLRIRVGDDFARRIKEIDNVLINVVKKYNVNYMVCELPHGSQNAAAAKMVASVINGTKPYLISINNTPKIKYLAYWITAAVMASLFLN